MDILGKIRSFFGPGRKPDEQAGRFDPEQFIYITLPGNIQPMERGQRFETGSARPWPSTAWAKYRAGAPSSAIHAPMEAASWSHAASMSM